jgi:aryl-alcohol dehydrogenase-like predicted oxidoreductase
MKGRIIIPYTSIEVSRLGFGTASLHHIFSSKQRLRLLSVTMEGGITHFDTAPYYGYGIAEYDMGRLLKGSRQACTVTTKVGLYPYGPESSHISSLLIRKGLGKLVPRLSLPIVNFSVERAEMSLNSSLRRMRTDYVDFLLLHEPVTSLFETDEMLAWLERKLQNGRILAFGVSGLRESIASFVTAGHQIGAVTQTLDSVEGRQADFILKAGRNLQFTYGYLSRVKTDDRADSARMIMTESLLRNSTGCILFSSRSERHIEELSKILV